jgi:hypothetical protein
MHREFYVLIFFNSITKTLNFFSKINSLFIFLRMIVHCVVSSFPIKYNNNLCLTYLIYNFF